MLIGLCRVCLCVRRSQNLLWLQTHRGVEMLDLDFTVTDEVRDCAQVNRNGAAPQVKARHLTTAAALALPVCTDTRRVRDARAAARRQQHLGGGAQQAGVHRADVQVRDPHDAHAASSQHALTNVFRCGRHRMLDTIHTFLNEFLRGFYDVVPMGLLSVFDVQEMELLSCGIEEIDVEDWKAHTIYQGVLRPHHRVVQWFWECVENFTQEQRSRLLQFVTGTSRVPVGGFSNLPGNEVNTPMLAVGRNRRRLMYRCRLRCAATVQAKCGGLRCTALRCRTTHIPARTRASTVSTFRSTKRSSSSTERSMQSSSSRRRDFRSSRSRV